MYMYIHDNSHTQAVYPINTGQKMVTIWRCTVVTYMYVPKQLVLSVSSSMSSSQAQVKFLESTELSRQRWLHVAMAQALGTAVILYGEMDN